MAWDNEPGKQKKRDPWSSNNRQNNGPPDLSDLLGKLKQWLSGAPSSNRGGSSARGGSAKPPKGGITLIVVIALVLYVLAGIFIVGEQEEAAVFTFGKYTKTVQPGPHWQAPFIQSHQKVNIQQINTWRTQGMMLTKDENIVYVQVSVQWKVSDDVTGITDYLFNVVSPAETLEQATESALRQVIGHSTLDDILTTGRSLVTEQIRDQIEQTLDMYHPGVVLTAVNMDDARAPEQVKSAFDDAIRAQEDEQRLINEALAYQEQRIPVAQGQAERIVAEATASKQQTILNAQGDAQRFSLIVNEYQQAPELTRERLYLQSMETILGQNPIILMDSNESNNLLYLPIDKLIESSSRSSANSSSSNSSSSNSSLSSSGQMSLNTRSTSGLNSRQSDRAGRGG